MADPTIACSVTGREAKTRPLTDGSPALPRGWKRLPSGEAISPEGLAAQFDLRGVGLPVQAVLPEGGEASADAWKGFRAAARLSGRQVAGVFNLAVQRLLAADTEPVAETNGKRKLPPAPAGSELYALARGEFPALDSQSAGSVLQKARAAYLGSRWGVRVTHKERPPFAKATTPVPIPDKDVRLSLVGGDRIPHATFRLAGRRFTVRLGTGPEWRRQLQQVRDLADGRLIGGEVKLVEKRVSGDTRNGSTVRREAGANKVPTRYLLVFSAYLPKRPTEKEPGKALTCSTGGGRRLWTVAVGDRELWYLSESEIFRWLGEARHALAGNPSWLLEAIAGYADWRQRISEDRKFERRHGAERVNLNAAQERRADKYHARLHDFCHKAARMLAGLAARQKVERVVYGDDDTSYFPSFPWFKLRSMVAQKLSEIGVEFVHDTSSGEGEPEGVHDEG